MHLKLFQPRRLSVSGTIIAQRWFFLLGITVLLTSTATRQSLLLNTNRKSYLASQTQPSACCYDGSVRNHRLWHLLTSAVDMATRLLLLRPRQRSGVLLWACLSVCLCVYVFVCPRSYLQYYTSDLRQFFLHITYGRGSVLLWRRSDTLCISGFVDDVMFAHILVSWGCSTSLPGWQRTIGTTSCSHGLLGRSGCVEYLWHHVCT